MQNKNNRSPIWVRAIERVSDFSGILGGLGILAAALIIFQQVLVRYILKEPAIWQIEMSVYLLLMTTFIGGAYGLKHGGHVGVDVFVIRLPRRVKATVELATSFAGLFFCIVMAWMGWKMWYKAYIFGWHSESLWGPSLILPFMLLPLGMTLISLQYVVQIRENFLIALKRIPLDDEEDEDEARAGGELKESDGEIAGGTG